MSFMRLGRASLSLNWMNSLKTLKLMMKEKAALLRFKTSPVQKVSSFIIQSSSFSDLGKKKKE